jgi:hypothetical protein
METFDNEKLTKYEMNEQNVFVGFPNFAVAQDYAAKNRGDLVEVAFKNGNDNPQLTNEAGLVNQHLHYFVQAGSEYRFIHSADPDFRNYADHLQERNSEIKDESLEEKYFSNAEIEISEDPIIVLKNNEFESVTSRERSKYLKQANVYEIGVAMQKDLE